MTEYVDQTTKSQMGGPKGRPKSGRIWKTDRVDRFVCGFFTNKYQCMKLCSRMWTIMWYLTVTGKPSLSLSSFLLCFTN